MNERTKQKIRDRVPCICACRSKPSKNRLSWCRAKVRSSIPYLVHRDTVSSLSPRYSCAHLASSTSSNAEACCGGVHMQDRVLQPLVRSSAGPVDRPPRKVVPFSGRSPVIPFFFCSSPSSFPYLSQVYPIPAIVTTYRYPRYCSRENISFVEFIEKTDIETLIFSSKHITIRENTRNASRNGTIADLKARDTRGWNRYIYNGCQLIRLAS